MRQRTLVGQVETRCGPRQLKQRPLDFTVSRRCCGSVTVEHWLDGCGRSQKAHRGVREERDAEPWRWPRRAMVAKFIVGWGVASSREGPSSRISISLRRAARSAPISHSVVPWSRVSCCLVVAGSLSRRIGTRQSPYELAVRPAASNPRT